MNYYKIIAYILLSIGYTVQAGMPLNQNNSELPIVVVVCSYNNGQWSTNTLNSIFTQEYSNFRLIIVDDCSSDDNQAVIQRYIDEHNLGDRVTFIRNEKRYRKLFNLYRVLYDCGDDEIVFMVDGDDSLAHPRVFKQIQRTRNAVAIKNEHGRVRKSGQFLQVEFNAVNRYSPQIKPHRRTGAKQYHSICLHLFGNRPFYLADCLC